MLVLLVLLFAGMELVFADSYLPIVSMAQTPATKGVAWANRQSYPDALAQLGLDDCPHVHQWWHGRYVQRNGDGDCLYQHEAYLWGVEDLWHWYEHQTVVSGNIFIANEPDLQVQSDMNPAQLAGFVRLAQTLCPDCLLVGPNFSHLVTTDYMIEFHGECVAIGCDFGRIMPAFHIYADTATEATQLLDHFYNSYLIPTGQGGTRVALTEAGTCAGNYEDALAFWNALLFDPRVISVFGYAPHGVGCASFFVGNSYELTHVGMAFRNAGN